MAGESEGIVIDDRCPTCGHDHSIRSQEPDELTPFRPGHSDYCDCVDDCVDRTGEECPDCRMDVAVHKQYGMCPVVVTPPPSAYDLRHGNGPEGDGSQDAWDSR